MVMMLVILPIILASSVTVTNSRGYGCYPEFSEWHSGCLPRSTDCGSIINSGVSAAEKQLILDLHNAVRSAVAAGRGSLSPAADMMEMVS